MLGMEFQNWALFLAPLHILDLNHFWNHKDLDCQQNVYLAKSVEHCHDDEEVLGSIPFGGNFLVEFISFFPT